MKIHGSFSKFPRQQGAGLGVIVLAVVIAAVIYLLFFGSTETVQTVPGQPIPPRGQVQTPPAPQSQGQWSSETLRSQPSPSRPAPPRPSANSGSSSNGWTTEETRSVPK